MQTDTSLPTRQDLGRALFARRDDAVNFLNQARQEGRRKEVASFEAILRKLDKLIAQYRLEQYAPRH